jgi:hypothetical protein
MKLLTFSIFIFLVGCGTHERKIDTHIYTLNTRIIGKWGDDSPVMRIDKDSVFFFQILKLYPYQLIDHNLIIDCSSDFGRKDTLGNVLLIGDTLGFFLDNKLWTKRYRFK